MKNFKDPSGYCEENGTGDWGKERTGKKEASQTAALVSMRMMPSVLVMKMGGNRRVEIQCGWRYIVEVRLTFIILLSPDVRKMHEGASHKGSQRDRLR